MTQIRQKFVVFNGMTLKEVLLQIWLIESNFCQEISKILKKRVSVRNKQEFYKKKAILIKKK